MVAPHNRGDVQEFAAMDGFLVLAQARRFKNPDAEIVAEVEQLAGEVAETATALPSAAAAWSGARSSSV